MLTLYYKGGDNLMKLKKVLAITLVFAMTVSLFTACGTKGTSSSDDRSAYPGTADVNAISVNITSEPPQLFTVTTTDTTSFSVIRHVMENLVELDANDKVIPGVATDWTVSKDGLNYEFHLRKGMKWTNGEPVTAKDFVFAWKSLLTPSFAADYAYFGYIFKNGQEFNEGKVAEDQLGFKAVDDYTLQVTLAYPAPYFLSTLAFGVFAPLNE
jgi:oligopeptide transport system substrate-binding protein